MGSIETLIGRDRELAVFDSLLRQLEQTRLGAAVWVEGDAGMGKSAVVAALPTRSGIPVAVSSLGSQAVALGALAQLLGCPVGQAAAVAEAVDRLASALAAACSAGSVVLVAEDLHQADEASLLAWNQLSKMAARLPVLLVSTCSPRPYRERVSQLRESVRNHGGRMLLLEPLADADLVAMAKQCLGAQPGPRLVRFLKAIQGNPGVAAAMLAQLDSGGLLGRSAGRIDLRRPDSGATAILEAYACRDLSPGELGIVREAALAPARFDAADVAHAGDIPLPAVAAALSNATDLGILRAQDDHLVFRHEVVRDACVRTLPAAERRMSHRAAATRLINAGSRPLAVAHHVRAAGELPPGAMLWRARLTEPTLLSDPDLYCAVLRMPPVDPWSAEIDYWRGDYDSVLRTVTELAGDLPAEGGALLRLSVRAMIRAGRPHEALGLCGKTTDPHLQAWRAVALAATGEVFAARTELDQLGIHQDTAISAAALAHAMVRAGRGIRVHQDLVADRDALADTAEARELRVLLHGDLLELLPQVGPPAAVSRALAETPAILADADSGLRERIRTAAAQAAYAVGQWDAASALDPRLAAAIAARRSRRPGTAGARTAARTQWEPLAIQAEAAGRLEESLALRRQGFAAALRDGPSRLYGAEHVVRLCRATGADAGSVVEDCARVAGDQALPAQIAMAGLVRAVAGRDVGGLTAAAQQLAGYGAVAQHAFALEEAAVCLAEAGDRRAAGRALHQAAAAYASLGAAWDVARADARLQPYGIRRRVPADQPTSGWAALTPAEFRVVRLVARGLPNRAIAQELFLSQNTVQTHLARIRDKLGLRSRLDIARAAGFRADVAGDPVRAHRVP
jgi:DNA-binding CsgD family transcriptional regulator